MNLNDFVKARVEHCIMIHFGAGSTSAGTEKRMRFLLDENGKVSKVNFGDVILLKKNKNRYPISITTSSVIG